jgi:hypothetical protein
VLPAVDFPVQTRPANAGAAGGTGMKTAELNKSCNKFNHAIVQHDDYEKINIDKKPFNHRRPAFACRLRGL